MAFTYATAWRSQHLMKVPRVVRFCQPICHFSTELAQCGWWIVFLGDSTILSACRKHTARLHNSWTSLVPKDALVHILLQATCHKSLQMTFSKASSFMGFRVIVIWTPLFLNRKAQRPISVERGQEESRRSWQPPITNTSIERWCYIVLRIVANFVLFG